MFMHVAPHEHRDSGDAKRPYHMQARAEAAEATGRRILRATIALFLERWIDQSTLPGAASGSSR